MLGFVASKQSSKTKIKNEVRYSDFVFLLLLKGLACLVIGLIIAIVPLLAIDSKEILNSQGVSFLWKSDWNPVENILRCHAVHLWNSCHFFCAALVISVPVSVGCALFITELSPRWLRTPMSFQIEMLAAIPSVVYGLWEFLF